MAVQDHQSATQQTRCTVRELFTAAAFVVYLRLRMATAITPV